MKGLFHHWFIWAFMVSSGVLWGLPRLPFFEEGLPYLFDLGGAALLAFYLSLGCLGVGLASGIFFMYHRISGDSHINQHLKHLAKWCGGLALGWITMYLLLMNLSFPVN